MYDDASTGRTAGRGHFLVGSGALLTRAAGASGGGAAGRPPGTTTTPLALPQSGEATKQHFKNKTNNK